MSINPFNDLIVGDVVTFPSHPTTKLTVNRLYSVTVESDDDDDDEDTQFHYVDLIYQNNSGDFAVIKRLSPNSVIKFPKEEC